MTKPQTLRVCHVGKRLAGRYDAQTLFVKLAEELVAAPPLYFERSGGLAIIIARAALKLICHGPIVVVTALHPGAIQILDILETRLSLHLITRSPAELSLDFPRCDDADEEVRLLSASPYTVLRALLSLLKVEAAADPFLVCLAGVIGFDHIDMFEALPDRPLGDHPFPDYEFYLSDSLIIIEPDASARLLCMSIQGADAEQSQVAHHVAVERLCELERHCMPSRGPSYGSPVLGGIPDHVQVDISDKEYEALVTKLKAHVVAGDVYQVVPSRTFSLPCENSLAAFQYLGTRDPSAYRFFLETSAGTLFGASPEAAVRLSNANQRRIDVCPIAGTRPRGKTADHDDRLEAELRLDTKEVAEHLMLVDLARNDVARVSRPGTRRVSRLLAVEKFASVMHLVSVVEGELASGLDAFDALRACLNVGTLSGAPKLRAIELIRQYEASSRGPYGGAVAWINGDGDMDSAVVIRSAHVIDGIAYVRAGAGIVHDSAPASEAIETRHKASAVLNAIADANQ